MLNTETKESLVNYFEDALEHWDDFECSGFCEKEELVSAAIYDLKLAVGFDEEAYDELYEEVLELFYEIPDEDCEYDEDEEDEE